jgi:hypothetical protein
MKRELIPSEIKSVEARGKRDGMFWGRGWVYRKR